MSTRIQTVFITGVSTGIGFGIAEALLHKGWTVIGTVRREEDLARLRHLWGDSFCGLLMDVRQPAEELDAVIKPALNRKGIERLDCLIHNAGIAQGGPLVYQEEESLRLMMETNTIGVWKLTKVLFPTLGKGSRVVMISSVSGRIATPFVGAYAASKFALEALTDAYRVELGMLGIRVISIQPGPVKTPIWDKARKASLAVSGTPYDHLLALQSQFIAHAEASGLEVADVVKTVLRAIETQRPKTRYLLTKNHWLIRLAGWLPDNWKDRLIMRRFK
jgi:NAD(P)-dependent dehydrogenase (short-subunit alcohol dehydrogenase family)